MKGSLIMHFKQLEAFVNVIKFKSFSKAAEEIYLSQPTISAHISALESEFGTKLIIRSTKEVYPSKAGQIFYEYASEMLRMRDKAILSVKSCATDIRGTLEIAASTVPSQYLLPELLPQMAKDYPNLFFELKQYDSREVANHIINMDAEIGIVGTQLEKNKCVFEPFASDQLVLITPNLEKYRELKGDFPLSMLKKEPFILREYGSGTRKETEESLSNMGVDPKSLHLIAQMDSTESIKQAVSKGLGVSITSRIAAEDYARFGLLLIFDLKSEFLKRKFYFVYHKDRPLSPAAEAFMKFARDYFEQHPEKA